MLLGLAGLLLGEGIEDVYAALNGFFRSGVTDAKVGIAFGKDTARDNEKIVFDSRSYKFFIGTPGYLWEKVKRPVWFYNSKSIL